MADPATMNPTDPPRSAAATGAAAVPVDEVSLYEIRRKIYPRAVTGVFATWRWALVFATQIVFYGLPWLQWNDRQAVLFDLAARKFYIFGLVFWPQDVIYLSILLILSAYALFLFTAIAGRLWCGYACPQTVYTEIFLWVERRIEGDRQARMRLDGQPLSAAKVWRKVAKHAIWIAIALWTGLTFVGVLHPDPRADRRDSVRPGRVGGVLDPLLRGRHLRQRRVDARAGVQVHVPVRALSGSDVRRPFADRGL